jgi:hypothetical protein
VVRAWSLLVGLVALLAACGGGDDDAAPTATAQPAATATREVIGPTARVDPRSGPPGTEVTVTGTGWAVGEQIDVTGTLPRGVEAEPYASATADKAGEFTVTFRLEMTPDGTELNTGAYALIARSDTTRVQIPFLVETRRPIQGGGPGG